MRVNKQQELADSTSMEAVQGTVEVAIPIDILWECFRHGNWWPRWNKCFFWVRNKDLAPSPLARGLTGCPGRYAVLSRCWIQ